MTAGSHNSKQKQIYFRAYQKLSLLENALKRLKEQVPAGFQICIIGNVIQFYRDRIIRKKRMNQRRPCLFLSIQWQTVSFP